MNQTSTKNCGEEHSGRDRILREADVHKITGLSRTTRWRLIRSGRFPAPLELSTNTIGWQATKIETWISTRSARASGAA